MITKFIEGCDDLYICPDTEIKPQLNELTRQDLFFSDKEILSAAIIAYIRNEGTLRSITHADIYDTLGITRGSRIWEERTNIISGRRLSLLLKYNGFISINRRSGGCKARYTRLTGNYSAERGVC